LTYFFGYRGEHSSNITRVPVNQEDEYIHSLLAGFTYVDSSPELSLRFAPSVEYLHYANDTSDDEVRLTLDASSLWTISPQRFTWTLEDNMRQVRLNPTQPDTPSNTVTANILNTGPDFYLRLNPVNTLQLGARFSSIYVESSDVDNERALGYARWLYRTTPLTTLSLNYEALTVNYKNEVVNQNYTRQDAFLRIETRPIQSTLVLDLGVTKIDRDRADEVDGSLGRLTWTRRLSPESSAGVLAEASYGDTGTDLAETAAAANAPAEDAGGTVSQNLVAQDIFYAKRGEVFYNSMGSRMAMNVRLFQRELEFKAVPLNDREEQGGTADLTYLYSSTTSAGIFGDSIKTKYLNLIRSDTDTNKGLRFSYRVSRELSTTLELRRSERESTDPTQNFVDKRVMLTVMYSSGPFLRRQ
jgi:hypothetical protein